MQFLKHGTMQVTEIGFWLGLARPSFKLSMSEARDLQQGLLAAINDLPAILSQVSLSANCFVYLCGISVSASRHIPAKQYFFSGTTSTIRANQMLDCFWTKPISLASVSFGTCSICCQPEVDARYSIFVSQTLCSCLKSSQ